MKSSNEPTTKKPVRKLLPIIITGTLVLGALISCVTVNRVVVVPPTVPGATVVGNESCAQCHEEIVKGFKTATHARLIAEGPHTRNVGCESCHGAGSVHSETGGAHHTIINPGRSPETCFQCHLDMKGKFSLPHHHPVGGDKVSCSDCHNPHKGPMIKGGGTSLTAEIDTCTQCHVAQRGPFVFEHEAIREGCTTCHEPHGSLNDKLLTQRNATLCLKCHFQQQLQPGVVLIGGQNHSSFLSRGTCWSAGCHEAVHGSHIGSSLRF